MKKIMLLLLTALSGVQAQEEVPDDVKWKGLAAFTSFIRFSGVEEEFGVTIETAERFYDAATRFEWRRALSSNRTFPFLMCKELPPGDVTYNVSGYELKTGLLASLAVATTYATPIRTLVNRDNLYCAAGRLRATVGIVIARTGWTVQPFLSSMKLTPNSIEEIERRLADTSSDDDADGDDKEDPPSLHVVLCPAEVEANQAVTNQSISNILDATLRESFAWWHGETGDGEATSPRRELWENVLADGVESGLCDETVANRLDWQYFPSGTDTESSISLTFDSANSTKVDKLCALAVLAALMISPDVCTIEVRRPPKTNVKNAQWLVQTGIDNQRPWFDAGIMGANQIVAVSDTGIDVNNCYFADDEEPGRFRNDAHRKIVQYIPFADNGDLEYGHGTHVVSTIVASRDADNPTSGLVPGIAPEAKVAFLDIGKPGGSLKVPHDSKDICEIGRTGVGAPKAKIHSLSWGYKEMAARYTAQASKFDQYMFDNDDFLMIVAAGNDGRGGVAETLNTPATAMNAIAVGASHSCCGDLRPGQLGPNHIADFSSHGPTIDGRTKPDVVAPGRYILSAGAQPNNPGSCDPDNAPGTGGKKEGVLSLQGTSMAAPVVAGSAALIRQYFEEGFYPSGEKVPKDAMLDPSGALIKAVLMNGAQYLTSVDNGEGKTTPVTPYDNTQNFGRISLIDSLYLKGKSNVQTEVWDRESLDVGADRKYSVPIDKSNGCTSATLSVTLVWMIKGAFPNCKQCLLNDLDLSVTKSDINAIYYPNGLAGPDTSNNAERVQLDNVADRESYVIRVNARNLVDGPQQFALVATGCFGGVANTLDVSANTFSNDDSEEETTTSNNTIIIVVCSVIRGLILLCGCLYYARRGKTGEGGQGSHDGVDQKESDDLKPVVE